MFKNADDRMRGSNMDFGSVDGLLARPVLHVGCEGNSVNGLDAPGLFH